MNFIKNISNKWVVPIIVAIVVIASTSSCGSTSADNAQPVNVASEKTCGEGWAIRLVDVEEELG